VEEEPPPPPKLRTGSESLGADTVLELTKPTKDGEDIAIELQRKRSRRRETDLDIDLGQPPGSDTMYDGRKKGFGRVGSAPHTGGQISIIYRVAHYKYMVQYVCTYTTYTR
jgi:hypothetical protein